MLLLAKGGKKCCRWCLNIRLFINLCTFATFHAVLQMRSARLLVVVLEDISALLTAYVFCTLAAFLNNQLKVVPKLLVPDDLFRVVH